MYPSSTKKIFIAQMTRMGDIVQTLPLIKRLKEEERDCEITLMCIMEPMELIRRTPLVDRLLYLPLNYYKLIQDQSETASAKLQSLIQNMSELQEDYDLVVNLTHNLASAIICQSLNGKKKSGRVDTLKGKLRSSGDWGKYLFAVVDNRAQNAFNLVDISIGMGGVPHKPVENYFLVENAESLKAGQILKEHGYKGKGRLVALQMGAAELHRAWPVRYFASLADRLVKHPKIEIVLLGVAKEKELGEEFSRLAKVPAINLIGKTKVNDLPAIVKYCDLLISNDTGTAHIAAAVGTKVLGLYFSTAYYAETAPYGKGHIILQVEMPCSPCLKRESCGSIECKDYLNLEAVERAADMMLNGGRAPRFDYPKLSVYQSRFLTNGTLVYELLSSNITEQYVTGFLNRMLWEEVLGLEHDMEFVDSCLPQMKCSNMCEAKIKAYEKEYDYLRGKFHQAFRLANDVYFELCRTPLDKDKTLLLNDQLAEIQADIMASNGSLMKSFHHYELMDVDHTTYLDIARQVLGKYIKLYSVADSFLTTLKAVSQHCLVEHAGLSQSPDDIDEPTGSHCVAVPRVSHNPTDGEVLYLGLSTGPNFGWGICGDYLKNELSKLIKIVNLGDNKELTRRKDLPGKVFHTLSALDFTSLFDARGTYNIGYTFFENELTPACLKNSKQYDLIVAGSTWCKEKLLDSGIQNADVLIQGIDPEIFYPITETKGQDSFVIFSGGKFELRKGQDLVLRAVKILQERYSDIVLVNVWFNQWPRTMDFLALSPHIEYRLTGSSWQEKMNNLYLLNGLDAGRIRTCGIVQHQQLRSLYKTTDIGIFPNRCEGGTNLVLMEYMACAKPAIASYITGHKDILTETNALILTNNKSFRMVDSMKNLTADWEEPSLDELIAKIEYAYHHRDEIKRIGIRAGEDLKQHTWSKSAENLLKILYE